MVSDDVYLKHQQICADLNMDKDSAAASWNSYITAKRNYTLDEEQSHWLACAVYVACRKSSTPAIGRPNTFIEGNLVSLTRILRLCDLTLIKFIDKCRKWVEMVGLAKDFLEKINLLERKLAVSTIVFKNFRSIFYDMFNDCPDKSDNGVEDEKMKIYKKGKGIICTTSRLMEFTWTLYLVVKSEFLDISEDLVTSYHLLLACCDLIYANAICSDRRDLVKPSFPGIPEFFFDDDFDPPTEPICVIDELCKNHQGIPVDAKQVREYRWKFQIRKLFERDVLQGDASRFTEILRPDLFDFNFRAINKCYEQYVLSMGDFDERLMLVENLSEIAKVDTASTMTITETVERMLPTETETASNSNNSSKLLTPLTGRQYLKGREGSMTGCVVSSPLFNENALRLHAMLKTPRISLKQSLESISCSPDTISEIEAELRLRLSQFLDECQDVDENSKEKLFICEKLFYKMLDDIIYTEVKLKKAEITVALRQDHFLKSLFACGVEIVVYSHTSGQQPPLFKFPSALEKLHLPPYHFYKIIELVIRTQKQLSRNMVKHLNMIEEKILDSLSWLSKSPLWTNIADSNLPIPTCEEVCLPNQLVFSDNTPCTVSTTDPNSKPARKGSVGIFFRKFYQLASVRMQDLCHQLSISDLTILRTMWTCFEHVIVSNVQVMKDRHLDQILMCTVYVACKVLEIELTFQEIMKCYRNQPQSASHVYRSVLLTPSTTNPEDPTQEEDRGDLIKFYNSVYVKLVQNFALKFSPKTAKNKEGTPSVLSPIPLAQNRQQNSPFRRVSEKHPIYIRCLETPGGGDRAAHPSPIKPLSYYFCRSPSNDLQAINSMIQINNKVFAKRPFPTFNHEGIQVKRVARTDSTKLLNMMEDRRNCKF